MAYLIPPMEDEPPPEFIAFVAARLAALRSEAARLTGGDRGAPEISMQILTDLAGRWRWLTWLGRLTGRDAAGEYLDRRLTARTRQWREDQVYPVEVQVLRDTGRILQTAGAPPADAQYRRPPAHESAAPIHEFPGPSHAFPAPAHESEAPVHESVAQRLASLLPSTVRAGTEVIAEAEIAWVHAYRRYLWRRYWGMGGAVILLIGSMVQFMSQFSATT